MSCFNLPEVNAKLVPINLDKSPFLDRWKENFHSKIVPALSSYIQLETYQPNYYLRITSIVFSVLVTLTLLIALITSLQAQGVALTLYSIIAAILIPVVLLSGGLYVLHKISRKVDVLSGSVIKVFEKRKWAPISLSYQDAENHIAVQNKGSFVDLSTLDANGSGTALVYFYPSAIDFRVLTFIFPLFALPILMICKMCYNCIRFLVIPFYILFKILVQFFHKIEMRGRDSFLVSDIVREMRRSLANFLKAPFYAAASMISLFYGLLDPLSGRVMYACVERDWNDDVIRSRGIWLMQPQHNFQFEGGGTRHGLGQFSYYLMGCFQPIGMLFFKKGHIVYGAHTSSQYYTDKELFLYPGVAVVSSP